MKICGNRYVAYEKWQCAHSIIDHTHAEVISRVHWMGIDWYTIHKRKWNDRSLWVCVCVCDETIQRVQSQSTNDKCPWEIDALFSSIYLFLCTLETFVVVYQWSENKMIQNPNIDTQLKAYHISSGIVCHNCIGTYAYPYVRRTTHITSIRAVRIYSTGKCTKYTHFIYSSCQSISQA